jgi:hypothetical protein
MSFDDELTKAARTLHREWESPELWPAIASAIAEAETDAAQRPVRYRAWVPWAAAAALVIATTAMLLVLRDGVTRDTTAPPARASERLLSDESLADVEQAETRYIAAIEALAEKVQPAGAPTSSLEANLRERLLVIDAAIAECRAEIDRNRFNAHLRRQLLTIYQEKRQTLERILELEQHAS